MTHEYDNNPKIETDSSKESPIELGIVTIYRSEFKKLSYSALALFLLMISYYIMKAVRGSTFLHEFGAKGLLPTYMINGLLTFLAVLGYNKLAAKYERTALIKNVFLVISAIFLGIWGLNIIPGGELLGKVMILINYFTVCVYILILTALLWSQINVVYTADQASRLVGIILLAGQAGASIGGRITKLLAVKLGTMNLIPVSLLFLGATYLVMQKIQTFDTGEGRIKDNKVLKKDTGSLSNLKDLVKHPYARRIGILILFSMIAVTCVDWQFQRMLETEIIGKDAKTEYFGNCFFYQGFLNIGLLLLAGKILPLVGPAAGLILLPVVTILASINYFRSGALDIAAWLWILCHSTNYTFYNAGKEVLYAPAEREVKTRFKALNDAAGYRGGDATAAIYILGYLWLLPTVGVAGLGVGIIGLAFVWIPTIIKANKAYYAAIKKNELKE
jgi:ATP/ADP translocase